MRHGGFRAIVADMAARIRRGELPPGARLPAERTLATRLGVNRSTVTTAYAELWSLGLVDRRQGQGTTVRGDLWGVAPDWPRHIADGAFEPTRPLVQRIRAARALPGIIDLSEGTVSDDLQPRALVRRILHGLDEHTPLGYPDALGDASLREVIAATMRRTQGVAVDSDAVLVTAGSQQALYLVAQALLRPGDAIAIEQPSYYYALPLFRSAGVRLLPLPVDEEGLDPGALRALAHRQGLRLVVTNPTYQNPTATTLPLARREQLLAECRALNLPVVEDNAYGDLAFAGPAPPTLKALDHDGRVLYIGTLSKTGGAGLRLGWITGPKPVIDRLADVKGQIDFGTDVIVQRMAADLLASTEWADHLRDLRLALRARRDMAAAALMAAPGRAVAFRVPPGGLHLWLRWTGPGDDRQRLDSAIRAGVIIAPGRLYGATDGYIRLTYARASPDTLIEGIRRLTSVW